MSRAAPLTKTFESLESGLVLARGIGQGYLLALANWERARMAQTSAHGMQYERGVVAQSAEVFALPLRVARAHWGSPMPYLSR